MATEHPGEIVRGLWNELGSVSAIQTVTGCPRPLVLWALEASGIEVPEAQVNPGSAYTYSRLAELD